MGEPIVYLTRIESFSAAHRLHSTQLSEERNQVLYGKCNNPKGHGHNYKVEVTVKGRIDKTTGMVMNIGDLKQIIKNVVMEIVDHKHLDEDVAYFKENVSTTENLSVFIWTLLLPHFPKGMLYCVKIHETDKNIVTFYGELTEIGAGGTPSPSASVYSVTPSLSGYTNKSPDGYGGYSPMTPKGLDHMSVEWPTTDIEVSIRDTQGDDGLSGQTGIIRGISADMCSVFLPKENRVVNISGKHLEPVAPKPKDLVKVIVGEDRETTGTLMAIDNTDGVVKVGKNKIIMMNMKCLCKMKSA